MALLGIDVGVIPAALGMLWPPWLRRMLAGLALMFATGLLVSV